MTARDRIILPLDVDTAKEAEALVRALRDHVGAFKVGLQLINAALFQHFFGADDRPGSG